MSKKLQKTLLGAALVATIGASATPTGFPTLRGKESSPLSRMRKIESRQRWSGTEITGRQKRIAPFYTTPQSDEFQYLFGPDGSQWYAICNYDYDKIEYEYYTEKLIRGYTYTIYDSNFNEIGTVRDKIELEEGETQCAQVMLDVTVTKGFFNYDSKYEVMVSMSMNTPDYSVNVRTKAYQIDKIGSDEYSTPLTVIQGYPVDAVNCAKDRWSEDFYITFLTEEMAEDPDDYTYYIDFLTDCKIVLTTYGKNNQLVMERKMSLPKLPGDQMNSPMMLCKNEGGKLTLTYAEYEKTFFEDPSGFGGNDKVTEDNRLIIDVYQMTDPYSKKMELINTTKIEAHQNTDNPSVYCTYYGIGTLMWDKDVDFGTYSSDERPSFVITTDDYLFSDDDHYNSSYYVYDADGKRINTIAENTYDFVLMSDLPGYEPQAMFINMGDDMNFQIVDLYSCKTVTEVDQMYRDYNLSTSLDRVATADGYVYASALSVGIPTGDNSLAAPVCWFDRDGELIRLDLIPTGDGIELAQIYMNGEALSPYIFNTDTDLEYMMLVKRRIAGTNALSEELLIASPEKGVLHTFTKDNEKGGIRMVYLTEGDNPELLIAYLDDNDRFVTDAYSLPFSKFAGGTGTSSDPYLIATAGDLQQIKSEPSAFYKLTNDIECGGLNFRTIEEFSGSLDGAGHVVSNLRLTTTTYGKTGIFNYCTDATVKDIDFYNASMLLSGDSEAALIAATSSNSTFDNIHVRSFEVNGNTFSGVFGGIVGKMWTRSAINGCEIAGANIDLPSCPSAGGMTGDIRTGCTITACAVSGKMTANNTLGGIVGSTTTGDEVISHCHVDANLKAENTVGGIVGFLDRSKVKSNYVEGIIEATKPSKWNKAIALGGIAGELEGDWQGNADVPIVNNLIGVSALIYPDMSEMTEDFPRQLATVHRVVGRTSYNNYFEDEPNKIVYESGVLNNLIVSDIAVIDQNFAEKTLEGTTTDKDEVDCDMLKSTLEFEYGTTTIAPWDIMSWYAYDPSLYYESMAYIPTSEITVVKGSNFNIEIAILSREELTAEDLADSFMCEFNEQMLMMTGNMDYDGKTLSIEFNAIGEGETPFTTSILSGKAGCTIKVVNGEQSAETITAETESPVFKEGQVIANGCTITVYDMNGRLMLSGVNNVDARSLDTGIYVATAANKEGKTKSLKFVK